MLLHRGEAYRIQPAELADGALTVESPRDDVAPCCIAEREKQPVGLVPALQKFLQPYGCRLHLPPTMSTNQLRLVTRSATAPGDDRTSGVPFASPHLMS